MNKEEILAKAQNENKYGDEREQLIEVEAHKNSALWTDFLCGIMFLLTYFAGDARWEYFYVSFFVKASYYCSRALKLRKKKRYCVRHSLWLHNSTHHPCPCETRVGLVILWTTS